MVPNNEKGEYVNHEQRGDPQKSADTNKVEESDYARVDTKLLTKKGEPIAINYNRHKVGADWRGYDVVIDNISIVNNYRAQVAAAR
jgi:ABC-type transporter MlaC component